MLQRSSVLRIFFVTILSLIAVLAIYGSRHQFKTPTKFELTVRKNLSNVASCHDSTTQEKTRQWISLRSLVPPPANIVCIQPPYMQKNNFESEILRLAPGYTPSTDESITWWIYEDHNLLGKLNLAMMKISDSGVKNIPRCISTDKSTIYFTCEKTISRYLIKE